MPNEMEKLKVLIPTDFSVQSEFAYLMVKRLSEKLAIEVHFLHVLNVPDTVTMNAAGEIETCGEIDVNYVEEQRAIALRKLDSIKTQYGSDIQTHLVFGKTTDTIVREARSRDFDLIVIGTKGAWGLKEIVSGSETQNIVRKSEVPVLSLMCDRSDLIIRNVLLVHRFEEPIEKDLALIKRIVSAFGAKVHLLQIMDAKTNQEKVNSVMDQFAKFHGISNYERHVLTDINVETGVIHFNQMNDMDLVCIGTHGQRGLFHSSNTEKLVNHMFKPIITFQLKSNR